MTLLAPPPRKPKAADPPRGHWSISNLLEQLGGVSPDRVIADPLPGTVTEAFYEKIDGRVDGFLVELVAGTLVEKAVGMNESRVGGNFFGFLWNHVRRLELGVVAMADGMVRMSGGNVRMPDVAFYAIGDYPNGVRPRQAITTLPPRLIVEVLSEDNTAAEIAMKLAEFFASGCRLAYVIDPRTRTAQRHTAANESTLVPAEGELDGGEVLPGFAVKLADLFEDEA
jgi:Uma2 family endonuclease